jgi:hypothetical protein
MEANTKRHHVFISHHHKDDAEVSSLTDLLARNGYDIRNSSIRAKPANQRRLEQGLVQDETIRRLLRMKISWAGTILVLIGNETATRKWVNWEVEEANRQGKRIVGVFVRGGTDADIPTSFEKYGSALVAWNSDSIVAAIEGTANQFQAADGAPREAAHARVPLNC